MMTRHVLPHLFPWLRNRLDALHRRRAMTALLDLDDHLLDDLGHDRAALERHLRAVRWFGS